MPNSAAVYRARLDHEERLERRAQQLLAWSQRVGLSRLEGPGSQATGRFAPTLSALAASRLLGASEFKALSAVSRSTCRELGEPELLASVLRVVLAGFAEVRGLAWAAVERLSQTEEQLSSARLRLKETTRPQLLALKQELQAAAPHHQFRPAKCYAALEGVSLLIQPDEKAHDEFAAQKLFTTGQLIERTVTYVPEQMTLVQRQKLWQWMKKNRVDLQRIRARGDLASAFVQWLDAVTFVTEELPKVIGLYQAKGAVQAHVVPIAQWALRPQLNVSLARSVPPPLLDPDMVGRLQGLAAKESIPPAKSQYVAGWRAAQKPILGQMPEVSLEPAPPAFAPPARRPQRSHVAGSSVTAPAPLQQWVSRHAVSSKPASATSSIAENAKPGTGDRMSRRPSTCSTASTENQGAENFAVEGPWTTGYLPEELFAHQREKEDTPIDFCLSSDEEDDLVGASHDYQKKDQWLPNTKAQNEHMASRNGEDEWLSMPRMAMAG